MIGLFGLRADTVTKVIPEFRSIRLPFALFAMNSNRNEKSIIVA